MIAIILRQPNGNGTYTARMGFVTGDTSVLLDGITCLPDYLESVSELSHRIDASRAMGAVPEPVEWSFDLIDWESTARRSVGILDGSVQLVGWVASLYVLPPGSGVWSAAILSETAFEVIAAPVTDGTISISCCERWVGNASTVGIGSNGSVVGIVVGGLDVTVKTIATELPEPISFGVTTGWSSGNPEGITDPATARETEAWRKAIIAQGPAYFWNCAPGEAPAIIAAADAGMLVVSGGDYVEQTAIYGTHGSEFYAVVSQEMYDWQPFAGVVLYATSISQSAVVGAASSLAGFIDDSGRIVTPQGAQEVSPELVLKFSPAGATSVGFRSYTLVPSIVAFAPGYSGGSTAIEYFDGVPAPQVAYLGDTSAIVTDEATTTFDAIDSFLDPGSTSSFSIWSRQSGAQVTEAAIPLKLVPTGSVDGFVRFSVEIQSRLSLRVDLDSFTQHQCLVKDPYTAITERYITLGEHQAVTTETVTASIPPTYKRDQSFAKVDDINALPVTYQATLGNAGLYANLQLCSVRLYGVSELSFGSSYAVVTPGPAPWWTSQRTPSEAAQDLLDAVGFPIAGIYPINAPSVVPTVSQWGRSFEPNVTLWGAASEICSEFWLYAGRDSATIATAAADGEILGAPAFTLGDRNDTATELVIEYDEWAGSYRQRAYIAHVDEAYDYTNPGRYYGGFGAWGLNLWNACHAAWMHHGAKIERTIQMPSVRDPELMGKLWAQSTRGGLARIRWASLQSRYVTFRIAETVPTWWAGDSVYIPTVAADLAGYDLTQYASVPLIVTSKAWDPMTLETTLEVALPPTLPTSGGTVIQQTSNAGDDLIQQTPNFTDNLIKQVS